MQSEPKTKTRWPLQVKLARRRLTQGPWQSECWQVDALMPDQQPRSGFVDLVLELHRDERTAYRFNLNAAQPHLFLLCSEDQCDGQLTPLHISASQDEAASFMDGEHQVLETAMPAAIQCWIDSYLGAQGELIDDGRKKKQGRGRSSGN